MKQRLIAFSAAAAAAVGLAGDTFAASYASGVRNIGSNTYEFILNEAASNVTINLGGGGSTNLGALPAGRHTFSAAGSFDIAVSSSSAPGFTRIADTSPWTNYERPGGLAINTNPASPYFGTIYVTQNRGESTAGVPINTAAGRQLGQGVYSLTADRVGVDLTNWTVPADPNDRTLAKQVPGATYTATSSSSVYRIGMDEAGNLLLADWTDLGGGIKVMSADLTTGGLLLRQEGGARDASFPLSDDQDEFGYLPLHGSIVGEPQATGRWGVDLSVAAMDEDLDVDLVINTANDGNSVWRWNVGATQYDYAGAPSLEVGVGTLTVAGAATGKHSDGGNVFLSLNSGVTANAQYNAHFNKWYLSGSRSDGHDASNLVIVTPDGDGKNLTVDWASRQFSIDNGLDGFTDGTVQSTQGINDIFRQAHGVAFSPDNTVMYVHRRQVGGSNPYLGPGSEYNAKILAISLDENGLPIIGIDDNGTPDDTTDDRLTGITPIVTASAQGSVGSYASLKTDAAGNLYFSENLVERLEYYSLGGNFIATTSSAGTFSIEQLATLAGDFNGDGLVNAADYTVWRDTLNSTTDLRADANGNGVIDGPGVGSDYAFWAANYGASAGAAGATVPEPTAVLLCLAGVAGLATRSRR